MKFYTSVCSSTRGQARRAQNLLSSPQSPVHIVRSDAEKGWERVARTYALETYSINWCEYWPFLDTYINLSSNDGLQLLEYYLQQRVLHSQTLKTIDQLEKFSSQYLSMNNETISNENDLILNSISQLIQLFYALIDFFNLNDFVLNRHYRYHLELGGFENQQNNELNNIRTNIINQLQWLSTENKHILMLFNRSLLNCLTMVFTLIISPSGCALIDQIQHNQYELYRYQQRVRSTSRLNLIGFVCPKRRQSYHWHQFQYRPHIYQAYSCPNLSSSIHSLSLQRCYSQIEFNRNNNYYSSSSLFNQKIRKSTYDLTPQLFSISNTFSSQTSIDSLREDDKNKIDKWHYFLAGYDEMKSTCCYFFS